MTAGAVEVDIMAASGTHQPFKPPMASTRLFGSLYTGAFVLAAAGLVYLVVANWMTP